MFALLQIVALCTAAEAAPKYTVHVRGLTTPERVIAVRATGNDCVLDAVGTLPQAGLDRMDMWIVRRTEGGKPQVLKIDWNAIKQQGVTSTNYLLLEGDRLFVQARPAK